MKKILSGALSVILLFSLAIASFAAPSIDTSVFQGATTTLNANQIEDGTEFDLNMTLYVDTNYDYFNACNIALKYDSELIDFTGSQVSVISGYQVIPMQVNANQLNATIINLAMTGPKSDGYCCEITLKMKVVDAAALKLAGSAQVTVALHKNDFSASKNGELRFYEDVAEGLVDFDMTISASPMTLSVTGGGGGDKYTVTYNTNGGAALEAGSVTKGESIKLPTPTRSGYSFAGWYSDAGLTTKVESPYTPTADGTLYAKWTSNSGSSGGSPTSYWKITFESNGGSAVSAVSVVRGQTATLPAPTKSGYTFGGWYSDKDLKTKVESPYKPTKNITLYAKWTEKGSTETTYTITYNTNGGNSITSTEVTAGTAVTLPTPSRSGYTFEGWYSDSSLTTKVTSPYTPTKNSTLYAKWSEGGSNDNNGNGDGDGTSASYTVTYNTNGGNSIAASTVKAGASVTLPTPKRSGYTFAGWYTDSDLKTKVSGSTYTPSGDVTLYAKWTAAGSGSSVPKTGVENAIPMLGGSLGGLALCAGAVMFSRHRKFREDEE